MHSLHYRFLREMLFVTGLFKRIFFGTAQPGSRAESRGVVLGDGAVPPARESGKCCKLPPAGSGAQVQPKLNLVYSG